MEDNQRSGCLIRFAPLAYALAAVVLGVVLQMVTLGESPSHTEQALSYGDPLPGAEWAKGNADGDPGVESRWASQPGEQSLRAAHSLKLETTVTNAPQEPSHLDLYILDVISSESVVVAAQIPAAPILTSPTVAAVQYQGGQLTEAEAISVLQAAGWPTELIPQALAVAWCESKWSPAASGDSGHSRGWFQLNVATWFPYAGEDPAMWGDPLVNARVAWRTYNYDIAKGYAPWKQWTCKP